LRPLPLHRDGVIPLYYQIQRQLLAQIHSRELKPGDPLLSEQEISSQLRVSRMTARHALKSLCNLGVAYSLQGKGTFVSGMKLEKNFRQVQSFTEEMKALGYRPGSKVLALETIPAQGEVAEALHLKSGNEVVMLRRVRLADSVPMGIECSHLPDHLCPGLVKAFDADASLYQTLWLTYGIRIQFADEIVEAGLAAP
jgi:GntR family transcriptional regulator